VKRRLVLILLLLVAGAIVNIAVAWTCALRPDPSVGRVKSVSDLAWPEGVSEAWQPPPTHYGEQVRFGRSRVTWMGMDNDGLRVLTRIGCGWPLVAMRCSRGSDGGPLFWVDAMEINAAGLSAAWAGVPLRPVWPGFAVNTLFYAAILWLPFGAFALRRRRRIKRGLCPKCAYPVGTSDKCTECGATLKTLNAA
jgi:hypothetical protein